MLRRSVVLAVVTTLAVGAVVSISRGTTTAHDSSPALRPAGVTWDDEATTVAADGVVRGRIEFSKDADRITLTLRNASVSAIPAACRPSTLVHKRSLLIGARLVCQPRKSATALDFEAQVDGRAGTTVTGAVAVADRGQHRRSTVPERSVVDGIDDGAGQRPGLRLISSPDFTNADLGDLRRGPNKWNPRRSTNSINTKYRRALATVLDDWKSLHPAGVLIAGDLVNGRWGYDDQHTGTFGPVGTLAQSKRAIRRAARTYYPQFRERFAKRKLLVFPSMGDHEYGDNPWRGHKTRLVPTYRREFARQFTAPGRTAHFADHPQGPAATTAYAGRPTRDVQVITLDTFDIHGSNEKNDQIGLDPQQLAWVERVLKRAQRDQVKWIVVQGHVPILTPVRARHSSSLGYPGGAKSALWRLFKKYGVDLYLNGEVHDVTARQRDGVVQISHGGAFKYGLVNALVLDFFDDHISLRLRDYAAHHRTGDRPKLWETRRDGIDQDIRIEHTPFTIGTATVRDGHLVDPSGILRPLP